MTFFSQGMQLFTTLRQLLCYVWTKIFFIFPELMPIKLVFLLGETNLENIQFLLEAEAEKNDDILQINVEDSYHTLSYKSLSGFLWIKKFTGYLNLQMFFYILILIFLNWISQFLCLVLMEQSLAWSPDWKW